MKFKTKQQTELQTEAALFIDERPEPINDFEPHERKQPREPKFKTDEELAYNLVRSIYGNGFNNASRIGTILSYDLQDINRIIELECKINALKVELDDKKQKFFNRK